MSTPIQWIKDRIARHKAAKAEQQERLAELQERERRWRDQRRRNAHDTHALYQKLGGVPALTPADFRRNLNLMIEDAGIEGVDPIPNQFVGTFYREALRALRKIDEARHG
jgi:hypothetical protein